VHIARHDAAATDRWYAKRCIFWTDNASVNHPKEEAVARVAAHGGRPKLWFNCGTEQNRRRRKAGLRAQRGHQVPCPTVAVERGSCWHWRRETEGCHSPLLLHSSHSRSLVGRNCRRGAASRIPLRCTGFQGISLRDSLRVAANEDSVSRFSKCAAKHLRDQAQFLVASPDFRPLGQHHRCQQMNIDIPNALAM
jgi:hypothetical protein